MGRSTLGLVVAGVMVEAGCALIWVLSPRLTAGYNADYTREFFNRLPGGLGVVDGVLGGLGPLGRLQSVTDILVGLEAGLLLMSGGYLLALWAVGARATSEAGAGAARVTGGGAARVVLVFAV